MPTNDETKLLSQLQGSDLSNAPDKSNDILASLSAFERALTSLFVWRETNADSGEWRVHQRYRDLFACLTPRQIKSFLRERLLAAGSDDSSGNDPALLLLRTLFHPLWKVWRDERDLFTTLVIVAKAALRLTHELRRKDENSGKLSGPAAEVFYLQFQAAANKSSTLTDEMVRACWPRKSEERLLLLHLLALVGGEEGSGGRSFSDWVLSRLGTRPSGVTVTEQVSSFQDMALAQFRSGNKGALSAVAKYADSFLQEHKQYFDATISSSLSNLAVLINDVPGMEAQCDLLFKAAVELARPGSRVPFFHVEFLLDALEENARAGRLIPAQYSDTDSVIAHANVVLNNLKDKDLEPVDRLYRDILMLRLASRGSEDRPQQMREAWQLAKSHAPTLLAGGREPSSRFNDLLDSVIGTGGSFLAMKEPLQGVIWGAQVKTNNTGWPMAVQIANDMVGESTAGSQEEKIGMRLNAALVSDESFLGANEMAARLAAIWSQSGSLLSLRIGKSAAHRMALAFLASLACGGGAQAYDRMRQSWERLGEPGGGQNPEDWRRLLTNELASLIDAFERSPSDAEVACRLSNIVFGDDYPAITNPDELSTAMSWGDRTLDWAEGKDFDSAVDELIAATN